MSKRKIIEIDHEKCNGCGLCIPNCPEGALQIIDGKARLVSDLFCDGLGACIGYCPEGAITIREREAEPYDERKVMENIAAQGAGTIKAHLEHLKAHGEEDLYGQAVEYLAERGIPFTPDESDDSSGHAKGHAGCPGARSVEMNGGRAALNGSELSNWPVQLHLLSPTAPQLRGKDVLLCADCVAYASGSFHETWLKGKALAIACPKLDDGAEIYGEKLTAMIDHGGISSLTVLMMEVPCCRGLLSLAEQALEKARRKVPLKAAVIAIKGGGVLSHTAI